MKKTDKAIRLIIALIVSGVYFIGMFPTMLGGVFLVVALFFVVTSSISFCPLYAIFGIQTCPIEDK